MTISKALKPLRNFSCNCLQQPLAGSFKCQVVLMEVSVWFSPAVAANSCVVYFREVNFHGQREVCGQ